MFNNSQNKTYIYILLAIFAVMAISRGGFNITDLLLTLPGVLVAITFHEFAHAYAADKLGDDTPRMEGRLNLNPLKHLDPFGFFMLVFAHIGWGKPVKINPRNFDRRFSMHVGEAIVAFAGPLMNFILAIVFTIIYCLVLKFAGAAFMLTTVGSVIVTMLTYTIMVNIGLGVFNLIPLPPLDGSKILKSFLPYNARNWIESHEIMFYIVFLVIWITDIASMIITPIINAIFSGLLNLIGGIFGLI